MQTAERPWRNRPSLPLVATSLAVVMVGALLPYTSAAAALGFTPLPPAYVLFLTGVVGTTQSSSRR